MLTHIPLGQCDVGLCIPDLATLRAGETVLKWVKMAYVCLNRRRDVPVSGTLLHRQEEITLGPTLRVNAKPCTFSRARGRCTAY